MKKIKVMTVFGTRPEAIKMAPLVLKLKADDRFNEVTVVSAQHRQMLDQVLHIFKIKPDYDFNIMHKNQTLEDITSKVLVDLAKVIHEENPDIVLVHGDTTTSFAASLATFYEETTLGHVEAGLRTWNKYSPFPEEMNRQMTDDLADLYFAPTKLSKSNLLKENHKKENIFITGNTAIDALKQTVQKDYHHEVLDDITPGNRVILVTMHRRENQGEPMRRVFKVMKQVVDSHKDVEIIYPVHLSPRVQKTAHDVLGNDPRIHLIAPLDVVDFHNLAKRSYFIMTDSGGVQEEAPSLGKPVLVLRDTTERPEGVKAGTLKLVGTQVEPVKKAMLELLENKDIYNKMANAKNPYGDGHASDRIINDIVYYFSDKSGPRPKDFE
ncbi:non-hydrolyzing UDP-N-acetylglucosamine 2-epimerase [Lactobacillus acetotolerans]|jgi:UDP-N-acetylglucosamine 2-epimerase (non-hydrolysing)|uniref:UDP-N-acetylglucosamine 2-epimerase (non-hydrolyzing) n=3 Tax=Lactobacillus acetotolerans TaxID=1600 RepID=A0A0D6A4F6_9LACO|nr:UDP-N-acetylglucosamine 2-epimerase (non-hydrolyzing) [Lactobacillus acetotolerans]KRN41159.1 UDP-N-acetylglucosamine 2-epimerase [Lactobacillus acetotolerans DSM 20749 = JCM 3825]MBN7277028.1 UDP-N-acetylglucosamine 2-epimerase (non-hydrolyzing) [Lactobacillus acetotolerans]QFG51604.1 UDP-N-acetylglucosamine 2-epimerase (non-hydrolyzing) [Lactobacillus acetotolerans]QJD73198.1 UDP-N-acetylglucosamine 2-epimerase (non-hydrolyzing) [Lactobacillus acetotolerans]BAQ57624.1 UDP-N-acetylglucosam